VIFDAVELEQVEIGGGADELDEAWIVTAQPSVITDGDDHHRVLAMLGHYLGAFVAGALDELTEVLFGFL